MDLVFAANVLNNNEEQFCPPWDLTADNKCQDQNDWKQCQTIINFPRYKSKKEGFVTNETDEI